MAAGMETAEEGKGVEVIEGRGAEEEGRAPDEVPVSGAAESGVERLAYSNSGTQVSTQL